MRAALAASVLLAGASVTAHPLSFGRVEARESPDGTLRVAWRFSGTADRVTSVRVALPARCTPVGDVAFDPIEDGVSRVARFRCGAPLAGDDLRVEGLDGSDVQVAARYVPAAGAPADAVLDASSPAWAVPRGATSVWGRYLALGVEHIATGWDHLAFVLGLALLVRGRRALLAAVTAFTLGHSVTLALAALGFVRAPVRAIEAAIAWSVVVVARAAIVGAGESPGRVPPWTLAALFGLLHGFGFAGALAEAGLTPGAVARSLVAFNAGVELGQVAFVALALLCARLAVRVGVDVAKGRRAVATAVGVAGAYWCFERVAGFVG